MPRTLLALASLSLVSLLAPGAASAASCKGAGLVPDSTNEWQVRHATLCLINAERRKRDLPALRENAKLRKAAESHSRNMVRNDFFDHVSPGGSTVVDRVRKAGYITPNSGWAVAENLAWGSGRLASPRATVRGWMKSSGHRRNILSTKYREVGIGIDLGAPVKLHASERGATYTTNFGVRS